MAFLIHARPHSLKYKGKGKVFGELFANSFGHYYIACEKKSAFIKF
jgi:hypothetical protein